MYALANIDFSDRVGFVVSELTPDETDRQDETLDANLRSESAFSPARELEKAVFGAA